MSDTTDVRADVVTSSVDVSSTTTNGATRPRKRAGLSGMVLAELQELAGTLGITGTAKMRKSDLIAAIKERQAGSSGAARPTDKAPKATPESKSADPAEAPAKGDASTTRTRRTARRPAGAPKATDSDAAETAPAAAASAEAPSATTATEMVGTETTGTGQRGKPRESQEQPPDRGPRDRDQSRDQSRDQGRDQNRGQGQQRPRDQGTRDQGTRDQGTRDQGTRDQGTRDQGTRDQGGRDQGGRDQGGRDQGGRDQGGRDRDDFGGGSRRRGRRFRDRGRSRERFADAEPVVAEDDVLHPVAGILDILDNYAFVRTDGYLTGPNDVYVSLSQVRKYGLRRGDAIAGFVRQPREGERKDKYNALVRLDTVNGQTPDEAKQRSEFHKLTPLYPQERLRLETEPHLLTTRVIDLVMPIGKGQRALIVSPPKAGKTMVLQAIANAITTNNPECHLMVVLVDERPEEVTDMQRSVKGEVIASTFDRPPQDHTAVAELSIDRAKRLVELGHDVVVLLDSITRLGRAYNNASPASGRILSGGLDSTALFPPKRFLGAARNIEGGGSLTIIATALVETGSTADTVIYEEFKGTGNAELYLERKLANKRIFPAIDLDPSSTRKEEILLSPDEQGIVMRLRRILAALDSQQAIELVLGQLKKTRTNVEFLMQVQKTTNLSDLD